MPVARTARNCRDAECPRRPRGRSQQCRSPQRSICSVPYCQNERPRLSFACAAGPHTSFRLAQAHARSARPSAKRPRLPASRSDRERRRPASRVRTAWRGSARHAAASRLPAWAGVGGSRSPGPSSQTAKRTDRSAIRLLTDVEHRALQQIHAPGREGFFRKTAGFLVPAASKPGEELIPMAPVVSAFQSTSPR